MKRLSFFVSALIVLAFSYKAIAEEEKILYVYNWSDYIAEDTLDKFEEETGIRVVYDVFDSNDVLETKLLSGRTGYDVVVPSGAFLERQIKAGVFLELDKSKLPNLVYMNQDLMKNLSTHDPGTKHSIIYLWGTTGVGYNETMVRQILGSDAPSNSLEILFNPKYISKLTSCGVYFLDAPSEVIEMGLHYLGLNPFTTDREDYKKVYRLLRKIRPYITKFHSSEYISALANGDICLALSWSGDVLQARDRADEAGQGVVVGYNVPKEGTILWMDTMAIPADAPHPDNAHKFLNFIMRPDIIAEITNYVWFANANDAATPMVDDEILSDPGVFPPEDIVSKLFVDKAIDQKTERIRTRVWQRFKTGS